MTISWKPVLAGVAGSLAGTLAMRLYWNAATALSGQDPRMLTNDDAPHALDDVSAVGDQRREGEPSTAAVGRKAFEAAAGEEPEGGTKTALSYGVHYTHGLLAGGVYGALRAGADDLDLPGGLAFGAAVWLAADEVMVPLLGLSPGPTAYPPAQHAHRLGAHLAYGAATAAATQTVYRLVDHGGSSSKSSLLWRAAKTYLKWTAYKKIAARGARALVA